MFNEGENREKLLARENLLVYSIRSPKKNDDVANQLKVLQVACMTGCTGAKFPIIARLC